MKITVDVPEKEMREAMRHTGAKTKQVAVVIAVSEFNRMCRLRKLADKLGTFDSVMTQEEFRRMREEP